MHNNLDATNYAFEDTWAKLDAVYSDGFVALPEANTCVDSNDRVVQNGEHKADDIITGDEGVRTWLNINDADPIDLSVDNIANALQALVDSGRLTEEATLVSVGGTTYTVADVLAASEDFELVYTQVAENTDLLKEYHRGNRLPDGRQQSYHVHLTVKYRPGDMVITKAFSGAENLPENYTITVTHEGEEEPVAVLGLSDARYDEQNKTYTWSLSDLNGGTYRVQESNTYLQDKAMEATIVAQTGSDVAVTTQGTGANVLVEMKETTTVNITNTYTESGGELVITKTFKNAAGNTIDPPADLAAIDVVVEEYYTVTENGQNVEKSLGEHTVTLVKDGSGVFTGTLSGVKYYTEFRVKSETMKDRTGNTLPVSGDYEYAFTFDRNYLGSEITGLANQTATEGNSFYLPSNTFILVKNDGSNWSLVMRYLPAEADRDAVKVQVYNAAVAAKEAGAIKGSIPVSADNISWKTLDQVSSEGVQITYQDDGLTRLTFDGSNRWAQFIYGDFDVTDQAIEGVLANTLKDVKISIPVEKVWVDNDDANDLRPGTVQAILKNGDTEVQEITLTADGQWKGSFTNLPKYDATGALIDYNTYTVTDTVEGYTSSASYADGKFTLTNTLATGDLVINKTLTSFNSTMGKDATFIFQVKHLETGKIWYRSMTFTGAGSDSLTMEGMPAGHYEVAELDSAGYKLTEGSAATVTTSVTAAADGQASFSNEKTGNNTPGDQDYVQNNFVYDKEKGQWVYTQG